MPTDVLISKTAFPMMLRMDGWALGGHWISWGSCPQQQREMQSGLSSSWGKTACTGGMVPSFSVITFGTLRLCLPPRADVQRSALVCPVTYFVQCVELGCHPRAFLKVSACPWPVDGSLGCQVIFPFLL